LHFNFLTKELIKLLTNRLPGHSKQTASAEQVSADSCQDALAPGDQILTSIPTRILIGQTAIGQNATMALAASLCGTWHEGLHRAE
jgi:hypothetical protein